MADLKSLKLRIKSVRSTQKITKAMKVISAAKLRKARDRLAMSELYNKKVKKISSEVVKALGVRPEVHKMLREDLGDDKQLFIVVTSDRGLCGAFNGTLYRQVKRDIAKLENKNIELVVIGKRGYELFKQDHKISLYMEGPNHHSYHYNFAEKIYDYIAKKFMNDEINFCKIYYNKFISPILQTVQADQIFPVNINDLLHEVENEKSEIEDIYHFEPHKYRLLDELLPMVMGTKIFHALLESATSEHASRMTAMDGATRNSDKMIKNLTLQYNRTRQAVITKELIEIISGAEAI
jgi:F-type H+-transporting ATPase subunit gamma